MRRAFSGRVLLLILSILVVGLLKLIVNASHTEAIFDAQNGQALVQTSEPQTLIERAPYLKDALVEKSKTAQSTQPSYALTKFGDPSETLKNQPPRQNSSSLTPPLGGDKSPQQPPGQYHVSGGWDIEAVSTFDCKTWYFDDYFRPGDCFAVYIKLKKAGTNPTFSIETYNQQGSFIPALSCPQTKGGSPCLGKPFNDQEYYLEFQVPTQEIPGQHIVWVSGGTNWLYHYFRVDPAADLNSATFNPNDLTIKPGDQPVITATVQLDVYANGYLQVYLYDDASKFNVKSGKALNGGQSYQTNIQLTIPSSQTQQTGDFWLNALVQFRPGVNNGPLNDERPYDSERIFGRAIHLKIQNQNQPPYLSGDYVDPTWGYRNTDFTYYVTYKDADNDPPSYIRAVIDGSEFQMSKVNSGNNDYRGGVQYKYVTRLGLGNHIYKFHASDGKAEAYTSQRSGPQVTNIDPEIQSIEVPDPASGIATVKVYAFDLDGRIAKVEYSVDDTLKWTDTNPPNGNPTSKWDWDTTQYTNGSHKITAKVYDNDGASTSQSKNITVKNNTPPKLNNGSVAPLVGDRTTNFTYYVTYSDADGDPPAFGYVMIDSDNTDHPMVKENPNDNNYKSGVRYIYATRFNELGEHMYYFQFSDGKINVATSPQPGPTVNNIPPTILNLNVPNPAQGVVEVSIDACDTDGTLTKVEYRVDDNAIRYTDTTPRDCVSRASFWNWDTTKWSNGNHTVKVRAYDNDGDSTEASKQVTVNNHYNQPPYLKNDGVDPATGFDNTDFTYRVTYVDDDNDPPTEQSVIIDGVSHTVSKINPNDNDYTGSGVDYKYVTKLPIGDHNFKFRFNDGYGAVETSTKQGPYVDQSLKINEFRISYDPSGENKIVINQPEVEGLSMFVRTSKPSQVQWQNKTFTDEGNNLYSLALNRGDFPWGQWQGDNDGQRVDFSVEATSGNEKVTYPTYVITRLTNTNEAAAMFGNADDLTVAALSQLDIPHALTLDNVKADLLEGKFTSMGKIIENGKSYDVKLFIRAGEDGKIRWGAIFEGAQGDAHVTMINRGVDFNIHLTKGENRYDLLKAYSQGDDIVRVTNPDQKTWSFLFENKNLPKGDQFTPRTIPSKFLGRSFGNNLEAFSDLKQWWTTNGFSAVKIPLESLSGKENIGLYAATQRVPKWGKTLEKIGPVVIVGVIALEEYDIFTSTEGNFWEKQVVLGSELGGCLIGGLAIDGAATVLGPPGPVAGLIMSIAGCTVGGIAGEQVGKITYQTLFEQQNIAYADVDPYISDMLTHYGKIIDQKSDYTEYLMNFPDGTQKKVFYYPKASGPDRYIWEDAYLHYDPSIRFQSLKYVGDNSYLAKTVKGWVKIDVSGDTFTVNPANEPNDKTSIGYWDDDIFKEGVTLPGKPFDHYALISNFGDDGMTRNYYLEIDPSSVPEQWSATLDTTAFPLSRHSSKIVKLTVNPPPLAGKNDYADIKLILKWNHFDNETFRYEFYHFRTTVDPPSKPVVTTNGGQNFFAQSSDVSIDGTVDDTTETLWVIQNNGAKQQILDYRAGQKNWHYQAQLQEGDNAFQFIARNSLGADSEPGAITITYDTKPPVVTVDPLGGTYTAEVTVTLRSDDNIVIHYTLDGSEPSDTSPSYSNPIKISQPTTLSFWAKDLAGNITKGKEVYIINQIISIKKGWNMISVPTEVTDLSIFGQNPKIYRYDTDSEKYIRVTDKLTPKVGYWIQTDQDKDVAVSASSSASAFDLKPGWNLVGVITEVNDLSQFGNQPKIYWWDPSKWEYQKITDKLIPGKGYWIWQDGKGRSEDFPPTP